LHYPDRPLHDFLRLAAGSSPERVALRFDDGSLTFRDLDGWGTAFGNALRRVGVELGDRVLLAMSNRPECLMIQHGVSQSGASSVLVNPSWKHDELTKAIELTRPKAVVTDAVLAERLDAIDAARRCERICVDEDRPARWASFWNLTCDAPGSRPPDLDVDLSRLECLLPFSSGTTGVAKAVRHSHRSMHAAITQRVAAYGITDSDRLQFFMALCTSYGLICSLSSIAARASFRLFRRFDAETALQNIEDERITMAFAAAPVAIKFRDLQDLERYDLSSLRWMMWAATPVLPEIADEVSRRSGIRWMQAYSTTEVGIASNPAPHPEQFRLDSPGYPLSDVQVRTVDPETGADLEPGQEGELVVRSPAMMMGYLPEEGNAGAFLPDGSFRTGDLAWIEPGGWIHLTDRVKELIKSSGFQVAPSELERLLMTYPGVLDCAVYGVSHPRRGEAPKAAVVADPVNPPSAEALMSFVAEKLATYKRLCGVVFVDAIPRNAGGKLLRRDLRAVDPEATGAASRTV
jgi:acyl-CoA synthetase (AMP-forming)/AMP-acid ligase II